MARKLLPYLIIFIIAVLSAIALPAIAQETFLFASAPHTPPPALRPIAQTESLEQQAQRLYEAGQYAAAIAVLQQAQQQYQQQGDRAGQAILLSNLALNYQQLGNWDAATQAIDTALGLFKQPQAGTDKGVLAQVWDVQGSVALARGNPEQALQSWQQAATVYQQTSNVNRATLSQINQAHALMTMGLFRRAIALLQTLQPTLQSQPDSTTKAASLRSLGDALQVAGSLEEAEKATQQSLDTGKRLRSPDIIAAANLSLGNLAIASSKTNAAYGKTGLAQQATKRAFEYYQAAETAAPQAKAQALLNQLSLLITTPANILPKLDRWSEAIIRHAQLQALLPKLPPDRATIALKVGLGQRLVQWRQVNPATAPTSNEIAQLFESAVQQATPLNDSRTLSQALGGLGSVYEKNAQWTEAQSLTQQALLLAQSVNAVDVSYQWQRQLGRVLCQGVQPCRPERVKDAIAAYTESFTSLQSLRRDLVAVNANVQFSLQESIEPIYRELIDLLLQDKAGEPSQKNLQQARSILEALQVADLENFLQTGCQETKLQIDKIIDQADPTAAVIYPIILGDRLEVILKLPGKADLYRYPSTYIPKQTFINTISKLQINLQDESAFTEVKQNAQTIYNWLIRPATAQLEASGIKTLIFALDAPFRRIPMSVLYDGERYLVEKYATSLVLGLEVREPEPIQRQTLKVLAASLTDPPKGFEKRYSRLDNVNPELDQIKKQGLPGIFIRDEAFTQEKLSQSIKADNFKVVHLATHGQFGATRESTYILTASGAMYVDQLGEVFRTQDQSRTGAIELLILSACKTAAGNNRAVLGIAGTAVRAGAKSAIASLWSLADAPSVRFVQEFYKHLGEPNISRSEALRLAQLALLQSTESDYSHPRFWAAYILVGSWL